MAVGTRARNAPGAGARQAGGPTAGPGRQLNAVAVAVGGPNDDGGAVLDNYLRVTRRAKAVVAARCSEAGGFDWDVISAKDYERVRALHLSR